MTKITIDHQAFLFVGDEDELLGLIKGLRKMVSGDTRYNANGPNTFIPDALAAITIEDIPADRVIKKDSDEDLAGQIESLKKSVDFWSSNCSAKDKELAVLKASTTVGVQE